MVSKKTVRAVLLHALAWACFITYEVAVAVSMGSKARFFEFAIYYLLNICLFYFNSEVVFKLTKKPPFIIFVLIPLIILELFAYVGLSVLISWFLYRRHTGWTNNNILRDDIVRSAWRGIYFLGWSVGYWFFKRYIVINRQANELKILSLESEKRTAEMEKNLAMTQVAYLRSQINPHFLYNSLNYIYDSVQVLSPDISNSVLLLSEIMRYSLNEVGGDGKVSLDEEIAHIKRYIHLMQLRFSNELNVLFLSDCDKDCGGYIPPLLLLTFVENVFKHGDLSNVARPALIKISCREGSLHLSTANFKRKSHILSSHTGIKNAQMRLDLYYPSAHELTIIDEAEEFMVELRITL